MCWDLLGMFRWFGMCKSETKAPGVTHLEPRLWLLGFLVAGWIEEIAATERQTCLLPMPVSLTQPWLATLLDATIHCLIFHFTAGDNHTSKQGELEWKTVLKLWTDGTGIFLSNECIATQKQCVFRCQLVTGQVKWVLGTRAAVSADTERSCLHPCLWYLWLILLHKHIPIKKKKSQHYWQSKGQFYLYLQ